MSSTYDPEEAQEWIDKVNLVKQTIEGLCTNDPTALKKADELILELNSNNQKHEQATDKTPEPPVTFVRGDGWKNEQYKLYCTQCKTEILIAASECPRCKFTRLITRAERRKLLQGRVDRLKQEYHLKEARRQRWEAYRKLHHDARGQRRYHMTNYDEWELWEDDIDWDDYMEDGYLPAENAAAKMMAMDMKQRCDKRAAQMKAAVKAKNAGNLHLKQKQYSLAIQHYTAGIEHRRDLKALYTNRALAYIKLARYDRCIDDCTIVIDMIEYVDEHERKSDLIFKAYLRRANAYQLMGELDAAKSDIERAVELRPAQKDARQLQSEIDVLLSDERMRQEIQREILSDKKMVNFEQALQFTLQYWRRCVSDAERAKQQSCVIEAAAAAIDAPAHAHAGADDADDDTNEEALDDTSMAEAVQAVSLIEEDKTPLDRKVEKWKNEKPSLLFDKLTQMMAQKPPYAVRFADEPQSLALGFKYLELELGALQNELSLLKNRDHSLYAPLSQLQVECDMKQGTLAKLCKLLGYVCSYPHNKQRLAHDAKLSETIAHCAYYILSSFDSYTNSLAIHSVHLCAVCCEVRAIRDRMCDNATYTKMFYQNVNEFLLYAHPNDNKLQLLQYVFDFLENLFCNEKFVHMSIQLFRIRHFRHKRSSTKAIKPVPRTQEVWGDENDGDDPQEDDGAQEEEDSGVMEHPHIYVALFAHLQQYMDYVHSARMGPEEMLKFEIKQAVVSSILTALATLFGPYHAVVALLSHDEMLPQRIGVLRTHLSTLNRMFIQFEEKNPLKNIAYMSKQQSEQVRNSLHEKHHLNISQITKMVTVFMSLAHHSSLHSALLKAEIHDLLLDLLPYLRVLDAHGNQFAGMLALTREHVINYFDQLSYDARIDAIIDEYNRDIATMRQNVQKNQFSASDALPAFWQFLAEIIQRRPSTVKSTTAAADDEKTNNTSQSQSPPQSQKSGSNQRRRHRNRGNKARPRKQQQQGKQQLQLRAQTDEWDATDDEVELDAQSGCIRIVTRWIRRRLPTDQNKANKNCGSKEEQRIIEELTLRLYSTLFGSIRYCHDPNILANAPLLLKQFIIFAKLKETTKPALNKLIRKHSKNKLKDLMALFSHQNVSVIQNAVTCMAQLASFDENLKSEIREMGALKAMSQLHMQHRQTLFKAC